MSLELVPPPRRGRPPARNEILRANRLAGIAPDELAARFGTPLYVYDLDVIERQVAALTGVLPPVVDLAYAVKANPALAVVEHLGRLGLGADVASGGELALAARAGIEAGRIVMTGPGKRDDELAAAVMAGIRAVTVESPGELARLEAIARTAGRVQPVMLRVAVSERARLERVRLVGDDGAGKFGMDAADLVAAARQAVASPHLELLGLHAFGASNVLDAGALVEHVRETVRTARRLAMAVGVALRLVDAGGGLGIPYEPHEPSLDLERLGAGLTAIVDDWATDPVLRDARLLLEPGRFLVGSSGAYLARVVDRKTVDGVVVAILDGGVHHVLRPALVGQEHRIRALGGRDRDEGQARPDGAGDRRRAALLGARCLQPGGGHDAAGGRRARRRARCRRIRLHRVDAAVPVASDPGRGGGPGRPSRAHPPAPGPQRVAGSAGRAGLVACDGGRPDSIASSSSFRPPHRYRGHLCSSGSACCRPRRPKERRPMHPDAPDDLPLLAERLRLGLPLRGFDGREIPLRNAKGADLGATEAAHALLLSGASLLSAEYADAFVCAALARAADVEAAACLAGDPPSVIAAKVTAVLVSAAVRASVIARGPDVSPSAINRATLSWYELSHLRRRELLMAECGAQEDQRQSA